MTEETDHGENMMAIVVISALPKLRFLIINIILYMSSDYKLLHNYDSS